MTVRSFYTLAPPCRAATPLRPRSCRRSPWTHHDQPRLPIAEEILLATRWGKPQRGIKCKCRLIVRMDGKVDGCRIIAARKEVPHHGSGEALAAHTGVHGYVTEISSCIFASATRTGRHDASVPQEHVILIRLDLGSCGIAIERPPVKSPVRYFSFEGDDPVDIMDVSALQYATRPPPANSKSYSPIICRPTTV
jgi:hypothetical protein